MISPGLQITANQSLLTRLFLIGYVVKHKKPGGYVWIDAEEETGSVQVHISGDGLGISEKNQAHIFERFYRAGRSRGRTGAALSLPIVQ